MHQAQVENLLSCLEQHGIVTPENKDRARNAITEFWSESIAIVFDVSDVLLAANMMGRAISRESAREILQKALDKHNQTNCGITYGMLEQAALNHGRKLTRREISHRLETMDTVEDEPLIKA